MTAAHTALLDQVTTEFNNQARLLVDVHKSLVAKGRSPEQAAADICALLNTWEPNVVAATCTSAVALLAAAQEDPR
jgi:hypothetical protein